MQSPERPPARGRGTLVSRHAFPPVLRFFPLVLLGLAAALGACEQVPESGTATPVTGTADDSLLAREADRPQDDYRLVLSGISADTLTGSARFGPVVDGPTGDTMMVIRLNTGLDFGGGFFLLHPSERMPGPGTYPLAPPLPDSLKRKRLPTGFWVAYRRGLIFDLVSTEGQVVLETVTDTMISGRLDVTLDGKVALPGGRVQQGEVKAKGTFRAHAEGAGFILGL